MKSKNTYKYKLVRSCGGNHFRIAEMLGECGIVAVYDAYYNPRRGTYTLYPKHINMPFWDVGERKKVHQNDVCGWL